MSKRFRHRFNFSLYDDSYLDSEIIDYLSSHEAGHARQEAIRSLLRAGFSSLIKNNDKKQAALDSIDPNVLAAALQIINNVNQGGQIAPQHQQHPVYPAQPAPHHVHHQQPVHNDTQGTGQTIPRSEPTQEQIKDDSEFQSSIIVDDSKKFTPKIDESTFVEPEEKDENRDLSLEVDDDDIIDPMSMFGDDDSGEGGMF